MVHGLKNSLQSFVVIVGELHCTRTMSLLKPVLGMPLSLILFKDIGAIEVINITIKTILLAGYIRDHK